MSANRDKGRRWEAVTRDWLIDQGLPTIRYESVSDPRGDLDVAGVPVVVECKDWKTLRFDWWVHQAQKSSIAKGAPGRWVIIAHRVGKASPRDAYIMVSSDFLVEAMELMKEKYSGNGKSDTNTTSSGGNGGDFRAYVEQARGV